MIHGLCEIFILGLHKIFYLKVCLNGSDVLRPDALILNLMWDEDLKFIHCIQSDFEMVAHLWEVSTYSFLHTIAQL